MGTGRRRRQQAAATPRTRRAVTAAPERVRILCFDETGAVLLLRWRDPVDHRVFWEPPGGGIEPGETSREAAVRELYEETGLEHALDGRTLLVACDLRWAGRHHVHLEEFFRTEVGSQRPRLASPTDEELATFLGWAFFSLEELADLDAPLEPPALLALARSTRASPPRSSPIGA